MKLNSLLEDEVDSTVPEHADEDMQLFLIKAKKLAPAPEYRIMYMGSGTAHVINIQPRIGSDYPIMAWNERDHMGRHYMVIVRKTGWDEQLFVKSSDAWKVFKDEIERVNKVRDNDGDKQ
jgi:hypothetical protein